MFVFYPHSEAIKLVRTVVESDPRSAEETPLPPCGQHVGASGDKYGTYVSRAIKSISPKLAVAEGGAT